MLQNQANNTATVPTLVAISTGRNRESFPNGAGDWLWVGVEIRLMVPMEIMLVWGWITGCDVHEVVLITPLTMTSL
jgi:hypothetical protein